MHAADLGRFLDELAAGDRTQVERMTLAAAGVSEMLRKRGMEVTLVGGGAIQFHAPGTYTTSDLDLVVEGRSREELGAAMLESGFTRSGRHWVRGDLYIEVPGSVMSDPVEIVTAGGMTLRVVRKEVVLADRIVGYKHWRATGYGAQAVALLSAMEGVLDESMLRERLRLEGAEDALELLWSLAKRGEPIGETDLRDGLDRLHRNPPLPGGEG